ncbi:MAG: DNA-processing protein DprA [Clostridia bacterium]|nr:DNA-processing protein DprA [Clostridia bacterium]
MDRSLTLEGFIRLKIAYGMNTARAFSVYTKLISGIEIDKKDKNKIDKVSKKEIKSIIEECDKSDIRIIKFTDSDYPYPLRYINGPPLLLFCRGTLPDFFNYPTITIVGPREVSDYGKKAAYSLGLKLGKAGFTIVNGAAKGADSYALKGAIESGGIPVGVLACGLNSDYLPCSKDFIEEIVKHGCILSEEFPSNGVIRASFPHRNRIMAGLSRATVVVEGGVRSGALITAKHAANQGSDVLVIPGNPSLKEYKGSNQLIRDGAIPLLELDDIFDLYMHMYSDHIDKEKAYGDFVIKNDKINENKSLEGLSKNAIILYNNIKTNKFTADDLLSDEYTNDDIMSSLTELELQGFIKSLPGGLFEVC